MNWLAHALLSTGDDIEARMGNLLADVVKGRQRLAMTPRFREGLEHHRRIDRCTDGHPVVQRAVARIGPRHRRFAPVLVDIFFDHFLARRWTRYAPLLGQPEPCVKRFAHSVYEDALAPAPEPAASCRARLPPHAVDLLHRMRHHDLLAGYATPAGVERALAMLSRRFEQRWQRFVALETAMDDLTREYDRLEADFADFFPDLVRRTRPSRP